MKRYLVFGGDRYYPSGGFNDFLGDYDNLSNAKSAGDIFMVLAPDNKVWQHYEWCHVLDTHTGELVYDRRYRDGY